MLYHKFKNAALIEEIKKNLNRDYPDADLDNFSIFMGLRSIDAICTKIIALEKIKKEWNTKIKPKKLRRLKSRLEMNRKFLDNLNAEYDFEKNMMNEKINLALDTTFNHIHHYDNFKKWSSQTLKTIQATQKIYDKYLNEAEELVADNDFYCFDEKGKLVSKGTDLVDLYTSLHTHLQNNNLTIFSRAQLNKLLASTAPEDIDDEEEFA